MRPAEEADVQAIVTLVESAYRGDSSRVGWTTEADLLDGQRTDAESVAETIAGETAVVLVGVADDAGVVACCQIEPRDGGVSHFGMFAVRPTQQGAGVGREMLSRAESYARERFGATAMEMTVIAQRRELIDWYERRGYQRTGETRPFPYGDERFGVPRRDDLRFVVLVRSLAG